MPMNDELLPCPFCGGDGYIRNDGWGAYPFAADCNNALCPVFSAQYPTRAEAVAAWNTRTPRPAWEQAVLEAAQEWQKVQTTNEAFRRVHGPLRADQHDQAEAAVDRLFAAIEEAADAANE